VSLSLTLKIVQYRIRGLQLKRAPGVGSTFRVILPVSMKAEDV
jgi:hypothetical protein